MFWNRLSVLSLRVKQSKKNHFHSSTLEDGTNRLSKNVSNQLPTYNALHPTKANASKYFGLYSIYFTLDMMMDICAVFKSFIAAQVLEFILITIYN
jgi:hypothetical protein